MNFNQIMQMPGKQLVYQVYYTYNGTLYTLDTDEIKSATPYFNAPLFGSVMQGLNLETENELPNVAINFIVNAIYEQEYATKLYGPYYLKEKATYNADTRTYSHKLYDSLLKTMVEYEAPEIEFPCTVFQFFSALCRKIGADTNISSLPNGNITMSYDPYAGINYTFRDVLDDLGQATATCFKVEGNTIKKCELGTESTTINDDILKNQNISFGEKFGPCNVLVLSRAGGSDNLYYPSELPTNPKEFRISDNILMNDNNRSEYMAEIYNKLSTINYDIFDLELVGFGGFDPLQKVVISTVNNGQTQTYTSYVFNNELKYTQAFSESIYTERPEETQTEYSAADTTDKRINQTYMIVDKQNQTIQGVVTSVDEQNDKIANIQLGIDELNTKISNVANVTTSGETTFATLDLLNVNASNPISVKIYPIGESISYLYPSSTTIPSNSTYIKIRTLRFHNKTTNENFDYILPTDLWYLNENTYDELLLSYENLNVIVTRKCKINSDGSIGALSTPTTETYEYPHYLNLTDGDYTISLLGYGRAYLNVVLMAANIYTTQFATKVEVNSEISQTAQAITAGVNERLSAFSTTTEMNSAISLSASNITSQVSETYATKDTTNSLSSRISQTAKDINLSVTNNGTTSGITITTTKEDGTTEEVTSGTIEMNGLVKFSNLSDGTTTISGGNIKTGTISGASINLGNGKFKVDTNGNATANSLTITGGTIKYASAGSGYNNSVAQFGKWKIIDNAIGYIESGTLPNFTISPTNGFYFADSTMHTAIGIKTNKNTNAYLHFNHGVFVGCFNSIQQGYVDLTP